MKSLLKMRNIVFFLLFLILLIENNSNQCWGQKRSGERRIVASVVNPVQDIIKTVTPIGTPSSNFPVAALSHFQVASQYSVRIESVLWRNSTTNPSNISALVYYPEQVQHLCPVIIYSHGLGTNPNDYDYLARKWASVGLITVLLHHYGSDEAAWRGRGRPLSELKLLYSKYWSARDRGLLIQQAIEQLTSSKQQYGFSPIIDPGRIGVAGNDLGALGAMLIAGQLPPDNKQSLKDPRVTAILALSPPVYCSSSQAPLVYYNINVPFMSFAGTNDDGVVGTTKAIQRRIPFDSLSKNDRFHVTLNGADHLVYSGHRRPSRQTEDLKYQQMISNLSASFWLAYLVGDAESLSRLNSLTRTLPASLGIIEYHNALTSRMNVSIQ